MIEEIIELMYRLSKEHLLIKSFKYDTFGRGAGIGNEYLPQIFLEEPILIGTNDITDNTTQATINFNIIFSLSNLENYDIPQPTPYYVQALAHNIGLNMIAKIDKEYDNWLTDIDNIYQPYKIVSYNFITLKYWSDNDCAGVRCTLTLERKNPLDKCDIDGHFDINKKFEFDDLLPNIPTPDASGCVTFDFKLPEINYGD